MIVHIDSVTIIYLNLNKSVSAMTQSEEHLLAELKEYFPDFKCTLQDLRTPTEEFVMNFYSFWLQEFGVDINNITQVQFPQATVISGYQDAYSALIPKVNILHSIRAFEIVPDFGMLDIISPTPKRTQNILRAFVNFYNYCDNKVSNINEKRKKVVERQNTLAEVIKERQQLKENLNSITKDIPQIQDTKSKIEEELVVLQQNLTVLREEKQTCKEKTEETNSKLNEKESILQKLRKEEAVVTSKIKEVSNQIVDSPSAILTDLDVLHKKYEETSELKDQKRDMVEAKMKVNKTLETVYNELQDTSSLLNELLKLIDQYREQLDIVTTSEKNTHISQDKLNELKAILLMKTSKKQECQEKMQALYLMWKTLKPQLEKNVEAQHRDLTEKKNAKTKMNTGLKEDLTVQANIDSLLEKIKTYIKSFIHDYDRLKQERIDFERLKYNMELDNENLEKVAKRKYSFEETD